MEGRREMDRVEVNWNKLATPPAPFKLFEATDKKLEKIYSHAVNSKWVLSDEDRTPVKSRALMSYLFPVNLHPQMRPINIVYETGDFQGICGFTDIQPGHKCSTVWFMWDRAIIKPSLFKSLRVLTKNIMDEFRLVRMSACTADKQMEHFGLMIGFKTEARERYGFKWDNKLYTYYRMRMVKEDFDGNGPT